MSAADRANTCPADHLWLHKSVREVSGVHFARAANRPEKKAARRMVTELVWNWPGKFTILTMPGLEWWFERDLLHRREAASRLRAAGKWVGASKRTQIIGVEREESLFLASLKWMPGADVVVHKAALPSGGSCIRSRLIRSFYHTTVEAYAREKHSALTAAWLDFSGPLTDERLAAIERLWNIRKTEFLILSCMRARHQPSITAALEAAGGWAGLLTSHCAGATVAHEHFYADDAPMVQVALRRSPP